MARVANPGTDRLPLRSLNMALWAVAGNLTGLVHHSDQGSNEVSLKFTDQSV